MLRSVSVTAILTASATPAWEPRTTFDIGARYRFKAGATPATLRAQVTNVFDVYRWNVFSNSSFRFIDTRRFLLTLAADI